jgi:hypothetical protein
VRPATALQHDVIFFNHFFFHSFGGILNTVLVSPEWVRLGFSLNVSRFLKGNRQAFLFRVLVMQC